MRTPTIVVRQKGEAWDRPFAVIHEPYAGTGSAAGIREVAAFETDGKWQGLVVDGEAATGTYRHYVLAPEPGKALVRDRTRELDFAGRYAVVSVDDNGDPKEIYVGEGTALRHRGVTLRRKDGKAFAAHAVKTADGWRIFTPEPEAFVPADSASAR